MAKFRCPSCETERSKKEIEGLEPLWGLGWRYICGVCGANVEHPVKGQALLCLAFLLIIIANLFYDQWAAIHSMLPLLIMAGAVAPLAIGFRNMSPIIK